MRRQRSSTLEFRISQSATHKTFYEILPCPGGLSSEFHYGSQRPSDAATSLFEGEKKELTDDLEL